MESTDRYHERKSAIHLLRSGRSPKEVAEQLGRSLAWVYQCRQRFGEQGNWNDLKDRSRAPRHCPQALSLSVQQAIREARSELEAEAQQPDQLSYLGPQAIRNRLKGQGLQPLPSRASIGRVLSRAGMTHPKQKAKTKRAFPHLHLTQPHQLTQVDIVPRYLPADGGCVSCFEAIDVVSRYPTGWPSLTKRSSDAVTFLLQVMRELGISQYTQIDNEGCFSGGSTHPGVIGKLVRLLLYVGTQPVFSPFYCPESNAYVERFHEDYLGQTWDKQELHTLPQVQTSATHFYELYRQSGHHSALEGQTPAEVHWSQPVLCLPEDFALPSGKLCLTEGQVHFIHFVEANQTIRIANLNWLVSRAKVDQGVWATLELSPAGAKVRVFDQAPDATERTCLGEHPFPLQERVFPLRPEFQKSTPVRTSWFSSAVTWLDSTFMGRLTHLLSTML